MTARASAPTADAAFLSIVTITVPEHLRTVDLGLFMAQALPGDPSINVVERGTDRLEALEQLVVSIDRTTAKLYEARRLAMEIIQQEAGIDQ